MRVGLVYRSRGLRGGLIPLKRVRNLVLEKVSRLDAFSGYPVRTWLSSGALVGQLVDQRFVRPGPLVLGTGFLKFLTRAADRDRTVSRRSKPSSRAALMGEQPNPWDLLQPPGCDEPTSRCQTIPSIWTLGGRSACYPPRGTFFYPLSDTPPSTRGVPDH